MKSILLSKLCPDPKKSFLNIIHRGRVIPHCSFELEYDMLGNTFENNNLRAERYCKRDKVLSRPIAVSVLKVHSILLAGSVLEQVFKIFHDHDAQYVLCSIKIFL